MKEVDESKIKATILKAMEDFLTFVEVLIEKATVTSKAMEGFWALAKLFNEKAIATSKAIKDFQVSEDFWNKKVDFVIATYDDEVTSTQNKIVV